jgi:porphobilinogen synthase
MAFPQDRPRRLRASEALRRMVRETRLSADNLIAPFFVCEGRDVKDPISSMPGQYRVSVDHLVKEAGEISRLGIPAVVLFGIPSRKDETGSGAWGPDAIIPQAVRALKEQVPDLVVITDVCVDEYTTHGHCGVVKNGRILNDATLECLQKMAVSHARAGVDIVAPSDMMDGRVAALRTALDAGGYTDIAILSYAAKFASCFYAPFREAADSAPKFGDRQSYQMDPANAREALREITMDIAEGADMIMVKPALPCLDVIHAARAVCDRPLAAYQVSGEYSMVKAAAERGWLDERRAMMESLLAIRRAGADVILTYFAKEAAQVLPR